MSAPSPPEALGRAARFGPDHNGAVNELVARCERAEAELRELQAALRAVAPRKPQTALGQPEWGQYVWQLEQANRKAEERNRELWEALTEHHQHRDFALQPEECDICRKVGA